MLLSSSGGVLCAPHVAAEDGGHVYETEVTAPASPRVTPREDRAAAASVITADRTPRAAESVTELLAEQAGGTVTRLGGLGAAATLSLRGSTPNQVLVYLDGVPLNTATGGGVDLGAIPLGDVERIEIYRGMSPIGFGASAIGGVVSLTTAVPKEKRADVDVGGGSFGTSYAGVRESGSRGPLHLYVGAHALASQGDFPYVDTGGTPLNPIDDHAARRRNNDLHQIDGVVRAVVDLPGDRQLRASALLFERAQGLPGQSIIATPDARLGTTRAIGTLAYESGHAFGPGGRLRATTHAGYLVSHFADPHARINAVATDARDQTFTAGGTLDGRWAARPWLLTSGVVDIHYDRFLPSDALSANPTGSPGTRLFGAAGLEGDVWARPLRLDAIASVRVETAREQTSGRDNFYVMQAASSPVTHALPIARLALIEEVAPWLSLHANGGRYARLPSLVELYGNTGYLLGNRALRPESGLNLDVGPVISYRTARARLELTAAVFASWVSDLIAYQIGGGHARADNIGRVHVRGVETSASVELGAHARLFASATLTDARDATGRESYQDRQLAMRPRYRLYARPETRAIALGRQVSLGLYADLDATAGNYLENSDTRPVAARLLVGAGAFADLPRGFCVRLSGRNLTDAAIYDFANYPLPGREVYLTLAWTTANHPRKE